MKILLISLQEICWQIMKHRKVIAHVLNIDICLGTIYIRLKFYPAGLINLMKIKYYALQCLSFADWSLKKTIYANHEIKLIAYVCKHHFEDDKCSLCSTWIAYKQHYKYELLSIKYIHINTTCFYISFYEICRHDSINQYSGYYYGYKIGTCST